MASSGNLLLNSVVAGMGGRGMGLPGPPMGGRGGPPPRAAAGIDGAKWQRGLQPPPPPPGMQGGGGGGFGPPRGGGGYGAAAVLHKADNRYQVRAPMLATAQGECKKC